jgi:hypothetical protein
MNPDELQNLVKKAATLQEWLDMNGYGRRPKRKPVREPKRTVDKPSESGAS